MQKTRFCSVRFYLSICVALVAAGCARQQQAYMIDPTTGRAVPVAVQQQTVQPRYATGDERGLFNSRKSATPVYAPQSRYAQQNYQQPAPPDERGLFSMQASAPPVYVQQPVQPAYARQYPPSQHTLPRTGGPYVPTPNGFAAASLY